MCICIYIMNCGEECVFYPEKLGILPVVSQVLGFSQIKLEDQKCLFLFFKSDGWTRR